MSVPAELRYTQEHEWVAIEGGIATIGITDYATAALGDVVFVSLPAVGRRSRRASRAARLSPRSR